VGEEGKWSPPFGGISADRVKKMLTAYYVYLRPDEGTFKFPFPSFLFKFLPSRVI